MPHCVNVVLIVAGIANTHQASAVASDRAFNTTGEGMGAKELAEFLSPQV